MNRASATFFLWCAKGLVSALLVCGAGTAWAQVVAPVATVDDVIFRSRWVGQQVDRPDQIGMVPTDAGIQPVEDFATKVREGLHLGSLRIRPGLATGWEYSDRNYQGQDTTGLEDNQSFFIAPSLGLTYARDTGPWTLLGRYSGAYTYFLNPNYSPDGTGTGRNPFNNTLTMGLGHSGTRHSAEVGGRASYGNGENIQAGGYTTTFTGAGSLNYSYLINEFLTAGAYASYSAQISRYEENPDDGSDLTNLRAGGYIDWLATGKTTAGIRAEAGRMTSQIIETSEVVVPEVVPVLTPAVPGATPQPTPAPTPVPEAVPLENDIQARQFAQVLVSGAHNVTAKLLVVGGLGASYTVDENIVDVDGKYTGIRPVYLFGFQFDPSEKTMLRAYTSFQGADVVPTYGLNVTWRPRVNTSITFSLYQNQNFSITSVDEFQVNRGFVLGLQQVLFSKLTVGLSGGWQQTEAVSLSSSVVAAEPTEYAFASASLTWSINSWAAWVTTVRASTGNQNEPASSLSFPETTASIGLNLLF